MRSASSSAIGPTTPSAGAWCSPTRRSANLEAADAETAREIAGAFNHWDDIDVHFKGRTITLGRPRFLRHRPQAAAQHPADSAARRWASSWCSRPTSPTTSRQRATSAPISSSPPTASTAGSARATRRRSRRTSTCAAAASCGSGTKKPFKAFTFAFVETRARLVPGARVPVRRRHVDVHRRDAGGGVAEAPASRRMSQEEGIAFCERAVRALARRPAADDQRDAPARLGDLDQVSARRLPHVGALDDVDGRARPRRADGRRRAHRALLDRLGHQARARGRDRARRSARSGRSADSPPRSPPTRPSARSRC